MDIQSVELWHQRARPNPTDQNFQVQFGCHLEEIEEMLVTLRFESAMDQKLADTARAAIKMLADGLKGGKAKVEITNRMEFLDSICDQVVTGIGSGHCAGMKTVPALQAVNTSNWSKFTPDGQPIFNENGKIMKNPETFHDADLTGLY